LWILFTELLNQLNYRLLGYTVIECFKPLDKATIPQAVPNVDGWSPWTKFVDNLSWWWSEWAGQTFQNMLDLIFDFSPFLDAGLHFNCNDFMMKNELIHTIILKKQKLNNIWIKYINLSYFKSLLIECETSHCMNQYWLVRCLSNDYFFLMKKNVNDSSVNKLQNSSKKT
jgi:hypothetical protein